MKIVIAALVLLLAAGCGGGSASSKHGNEADPTPSVDPTVAEHTLAQICPQVEGVALDPFDVPTQADWIKLRSDLTSFAAAGNLEARNAIGIVTDAVQVFVDGPAAGTEFTDAMSGYTAAIDSFAARCKTAGSSAFQ